MGDHGTTRKRPLAVFESTEQAQLLPLTRERFDPPDWAKRKVHPDHHISFDKAIYPVAADLSDPREKVDWYRSHACECPTCPHMIRANGLGARALTVLGGPPIACPMPESAEAAPIPITIFSIDAASSGELLS